MRKAPNVKANRCRIRDGLFASLDSWGATGAYRIPQKHGPDLMILVTDGTDPTCPEALGWEHVSVSTAIRCPTWEEMCLVKDLFWREDEVVYQLHPARSEYVNDHPYTLHLWRRVDQEPPLPPKTLVGYSHLLQPKEKQSS